MWICTAHRQRTPGERSSLCHLFMIEMIIAGCAASPPTGRCRHAVPVRVTVPGCRGQPAAGAPPAAQQCPHTAVLGSGKPRPGKGVTHTLHSVGQSPAGPSPLRASPHTLHPQHHRFGEARSWQERAAPRETRLARESCPHRRQHLLTRAAGLCKCKLKCKQGCQRHCGALSSCHS